MTTRSIDMALYAMVAVIAAFAILLTATAGVAVIDAVYPKDGPCLAALPGPQ